VFGHGKYADQRFANTKEEVNAIVQEFINKKVDAYFGCAKFGLADNRTHENALHFKSLWMDVDCGPTKGVPDDEGIVKGYLTQELALQALQKFCKAVGLPKPILVNSGNGIHAYWLLEETLDRRTWAPLSKRLRELCQEHDLIVDGSVFEASRILRIPGTFNFKNKDNPLPITVISEKTTRMTYEWVREKLGAPAPKEDVAPDFIPRKLSPLTEALMGNKVKRFKTIMMRSVKGDGCTQLLHCFKNQNSIDEPLWRSALSITAFCIDKDDAAHKMSSKHEGYDPQEVDKKVAYIVKTGGPHTCEQFKKLNPTGCDGCVHEGKIRSPIVLGVEIEQAEQEDNKVVVEEKKITIPEYPFPYFRGKKGGIYKRNDEEGEPDIVYEHDFYVVKRLSDSVLGEIALFRLHLPLDGIREFSIPTSVISSKDDLRKVLASRGIIAYSKEYELISRYVVTVIKNMQFEKKAEIMRNQFGWVDNDSKFVVGDKEITKDGVFYNPPSNATKTLAPLFHQKGTLEKWKECFNMYSAPGLEPNAFAALVGFASPIFKFTGLHGALVNVIYKHGGSGKTTTLNMAASIWGKPEGLVSTYKDTYNAKMIKLGILNNLPNIVDEITNMTGEQFSNYAYSISGGKDKDRASTQSNTLRVNDSTWNNLTLCSANASFYEKLSVIKAAANAEQLRLLEYEITPNNIIDVAVGKKMFDHQLNENYGWAGEIFMQYCVNNLEDVKKLIFKIQARMDKEVKFTSAERFWSAQCACIIASGLIAKHLDLCNYNMLAIYDWAKLELSKIKVDIKPAEDTPTASLGEFINAYLNNMLVVNGEVDSRSGLTSLPIREPKGELLIRYEPDTKELYVAAKQFKEFCIKSQNNYKNVLKEMGDVGVFKEGTNKRMSKGMAVASPPIRVLRFDLANSDLLNMDVIAPQNADRDDQL
jgi:uncharacterized protein (DUF927 family)